MGMMGMGSGRAFSATSGLGLFSRNTSLGVLPDGGLFEADGMGQTDLFSSLMKSLTETTKATAAPMTSASVTSLTSMLAAKNAPLVESAKHYLAVYKKDRSLIPSLPSKDQYDEAMDIVEQKYPPGFLGIGRGKYNLGNLADRMENSYIPSGEFYRLDIDNGDLEISDSRVKRLDAFKDGVKDLRNYMKQFIVLPTVTEIETQEKVILKQTGLSSDDLITKAAAAADLARKQRTAETVIVARTLADQAREAAKIEKNAENENAANAIYEEMDALAKQLGVKGTDATKSKDQEGDETDYLPYILAGVGGLALVGILALVLRK
jgi:hypothetical protein